MIDHSKEPGRIDLRAIEEASRPPDADRVISGALARSAEFLGKPQPHVFAALEAYSRPLFAAAAILLMIATGSLAITSGRSGDVEPETVLAEWAQANHVPTNAELLVAFQGYGR
jgi:hypothetical protein